MLKCPGNLGLSEGTKISGKKKERQQAEIDNIYFDFFKIIFFKNLDRQSLRLKAVAVAPKYVVLQMLHLFRTLFQDMNANSFNLFQIELNRMWL